MTTKFKVAEPAWSVTKLGMRKGWVKLSPVNYTQTEKTPKPGKELQYKESFK